MEKFLEAPGSLGSADSVNILASGKPIMDRDGKFVASSVVRASVCQTALQEVEIAMASIQEARTAASRSKAAALSGPPSLPRPSTSEQAQRIASVSNRLGPSPKPPSFTSANDFPALGAAPASMAPRTAPQRINPAAQRIQPAASAASPAPWGNGTATSTTQFSAPTSSVSNPLAATPDGAPPPSSSPTPSSARPVPVRPAHILVPDTHPHLRSPSPAFTSSTPDLEGSGPSHGSAAAAAAAAPVPPAEAPLVAALARAYGAILSSGALDAPPSAPSLVPRVLRLAQLLAAAATAPALQCEGCTFLRTPAHAALFACTALLHARPVVFLLGRRLLDALTMPALAALLRIHAPELLAAARAALDDPQASEQRVARAYDHMQGPQVALETLFDPPAMSSAARKTFETASAKASLLLRDAEGRLASLGTPDASGSSAAEKALLALMDSTRAFSRQLAELPAPGLYAFGAQLLKDALGGPPALDPDRQGVPSTSSSTASFGPSRTSPVDRMASISNRVGAGPQTSEGFGGPGRGRPAPSGGGGGGGGGQGMEAAVLRARSLLQLLRFVPPQLRSYVAFLHALDSYRLNQILIAQLLHAIHALSEDVTRASRTSRAIYGLADSLTILQTFALLLSFLAFSIHDELGSSALPRTDPGRFPGPIDPLAVLQEALGRGALTASVPWVIEYLRFAPKIPAVLGQVAALFKTLAAHSALQPGYAGANPGLLCVRQRIDKFLADLPSQLLETAAVPLRPELSDALEAYRVLPPPSATDQPPAPEPLAAREPSLYTTSPALSGLDSMASVFDVRYLRCCLPELEPALAAVRSVAERRPPASTPSTTPPSVSGASHGHYHHHHLAPGTARISATGVSILTPAILVPERIRGALGLPPQPPSALALSLRLAFLNSHTRMRHVVEIVADEVANNAVRGALASPSLHAIMQAAGHFVERCLDSLRQKTLEGSVIDCYLGPDAHLDVVDSTPWDTLRSDAEAVLRIAISRTHPDLQGCALVLTAPQIVEHCTWYAPAAVMLLVPQGVVDVGGDGVVGAACCVATESALEICAGSLANQIRAFVQNGLQSLTDAAVTKLHQAIVAAKRKREAHGGGRGAGGGAGRSSGASTPRSAASHGSSSFHPGSSADAPTASLPMQGAAAASDPHGTPSLEAPKPPTGRRVISPQVVNPLPSGTALFDQLWGEFRRAWPGIVATAGPTVAPRSPVPGGVAAPLLPMMSAPVGPPGTPGTPPTAERPYASTPGGGTVAAVTPPPPSPWSPLHFTPGPVPPLADRVPPVIKVAAALPHLRVLMEVNTVRASYLDAEGRVPRAEGSKLHIMPGGVPGPAGGQPGLHVHGVGTGHTAPSTPGPAEAQAGPRAGQLPMAAAGTGVSRV